MSIAENILARRFRGADGIELAADVGGDASHPAVIMLHGGGQTRHSWGTAMAELVGRGFHVINLDTRGHGDSAWSQDGDYALDTLAADLCAVIDTLPSTPALVGASMGGATALYAVGKSIRTIARALVLVDVVPRVEREGAAKIRKFMQAQPEGFASLQEAADAVAAYYPHRPRPQDPSGLMKNLRERTDGRLRWHWDPKFVSHPRRLDPSQLAEELLRAARGVRVPSLLVRGMQSDIVSQSGVDEFLVQLPGLEVYDVAGAGHMVAGDRNDAFNQGVIAFLDRCMKS